MKLKTNTELSVDTKNVGVMDMELTPVNEFKSPASAPQKKTTNHSNSKQFGKATPIPKKKVSSSSSPNYEPMDCSEGLQLEVETPPTYHHARAFPSFLAIKITSASCHDIILIIRH